MAATLFDFNGVLVDDEHVHLAAFRVALAPLGLTVTDADYTERYMGLDDRGAFRAILADAGRDPTEDLVRDLVLQKKPAYRAKIEHALAVFPGAVELVKRRAQVGVVGVVSGALADEIDFCLGRMGISQDVRFVVSAERTSRCKPDPEGYLLGIEELVRAGADPASAVVIEDSLAGIRAAKMAGLRCAAVAHSYPEHDLVLAGADVVVVELGLLSDRALDER